MLVATRWKWLLVNCAPEKYTETTNYAHQVAEQRRREWERVAEQEKAQKVCYWWLFFIPPFFGVIAAKRRNAAYDGRFRQRFVAARIGRVRSISPSPVHGPTVALFWLARVSVLPLPTQQQQIHSRQRLQLRQRNRRPTPKQKGILP